MRHEGRIDGLLARMTLAEKVGQMAQLSGTHEAFEGLIRRGAVGSFLNVVGEQAREYQRLAVEGSRLGIPLIFGRDVIHGFRTIFPIPLGQAGSFPARPSLLARFALGRRLIQRGIQPKAGHHADRVLQAPQAVQHVDHSETAVRYHHEGSLGQPTSHLQQQLLRLIGVTVQMCLLR
jgi:hypothetical protein